MRVTDEVELTALVDELVRVNAPSAQLVALHRVVIEHDRLAPEDRRLDFREPVRELVAAGRARETEGDRVLLGCCERAGTPPGDLLEREPQRFGVGELAVQELK